MSIDRIQHVLDRLDGVQRSGGGWRARCPACEGRSRKLSISEADEGRVLLHCFGGCDAAAVIQAVGLTLADLFPERLAAQTPEARRMAQRMARLTQWGAALEVLAEESTIVSIAAADLAQGLTLSDEDLARLELARQRIDSARGLLRDSPKWRPQFAPTNRPKPQLVVSK
ncbi:hypothetical protein GCM10011521_12160 [Arenimonas soli]|uniref:DNA primase n=1 Tax=Arenimonas soli TaxID=2269504 RepID=A0ABQ1HFM6_9GAMM|nr:DNA primase [Arenimonas soli]GGA75566.1 hypothetical protein GCM10011521_12160 [Arenimonas soli]